MINEFAVEQIHDAINHVFDSKVDANSINIEKINQIFVYEDIMLMERYLNNKYNSTSNKSYKNDTYGR